MRSVRCESGAFLGDLRNFAICEATFKIKPLRPPRQGEKTAELPWRALEFTHRRADEELRCDFRRAFRDLLRKKVRRPRMSQLGLKPV
jgi:hypothetical protein